MATKGRCIFIITSGKFTTMEKQQLSTPLFRMNTTSARPPPRITTRSIAVVGNARVSRRGFLGAFLAFGIFRAPL